MTPPMTTSPVCVADGVDVDLGGVLEEAVDQHRARRRQPALAAQAAEAGQLGHGPAQALVVVDDLHGPAAQHVARAAAAPGSRCARRWPAASASVVAVPPAGCGISRRAHRAFQRSRSSARSIEPGRVPSTRPSGSEAASLSGVWPPSETITPTSSPAACSASMHVQRVLERERLEVQAVGRVVVGGHRLGVAVEHHGLEARRRPGRSWRARSSSRTRCPGRCGWAPSRGSAPCGARWGAPRPRPRRSSSGTASRPRTRRRRCRRS